MAQPEVQPASRGIVSPNDPERRWIHSLLVVSTITVSLLLIGLVSNILLYFSDILLIFFLAWLLAFVLSPIVSGIIRLFPTLPRALVTILIYLVIMVALTALVLLVAGSLATSIASFVSSLPDIQRRLPEILAPWQARVDSLGLSVNLVNAAQDVLNNLGSLGGNLVKPLTDLVVGTLGVFGSFLLIVFLSLFMVMDKDRLVMFFNRLVPPRYSDEVHLFETSVASSFGGFIRGQAIQGLIYGGIAALLHLVLGIDYGPASAALVGILMTIPFFGPFFSWAPPVIAAAISTPDAVIPALIVMGIGWFIVMNIVQPRVMATAVGIHPIAVLGSVLIGLKLAGVAGAIFGLPIAAVISAFFFHYLNRSNGEPRDLTHRAARRLGRADTCACRRHRSSGRAPPALEAGHPAARPRRTRRSRSAPWRIPCRRRATPPAQPRSPRTLRHRRRVRTDPRGRRHQRRPAGGHRDRRRYRRPIRQRGARWVGGSHPHPAKPASGRPRE
jgi:predicted PurR-regulated permease PerM